MLGSLMMFASGVCASSPSSAERVGDALLGAQTLGELREDASGERDVAHLDLDPGRAREGLDDRQQRVRRQRGRLVGAGVDDPHRAGTLSSPGGRASTASAPTAAARAPTIPWETRISAICTAFSAGALAEVVADDERG